MRLMRAALACGALGFVLAAPGGAAREGGISVTVRKTAVLPFYTASIGTYYTVVTSATWGPPAIRTEGAIYYTTCSPENQTKRCKPSGSPRVLSFGTGGAQLHTSEAHGGLMGVFAGDRVRITARWRVYNPTPAGAVDGVGEAAPNEFSVPEGLPPRFRDVAKVAFAGSGVTMYVECASLSMNAGGYSGGSLEGFNEVGEVLSPLACGGADSMMDLSFDPVDARFRSIARPAIPKVAKIVASGELTPNAAAAFNALATARARAIGYLRAVVTSVNRAQGARAKKAEAWEEKQMRAAGRFATALSGALDDELRARPKLARELATVDQSGVAPTSEDVAEHTASLIGRGLPPKLAAGLTRLGVSKAEQKLVIGWLLAADPAELTGSPFARMASPRLLASLRGTSAALKQFSKQVAKTPLSTGP